MRASENGVELIQTFEGLELEAYQDAVGVWTIGYGHTTAAGRPAVYPGMSMSEEEAEATLRADLVQYEDAVERLVKVSLNQNEFDALVSWVFNLGEGNMRRSTWLQRLNAGDREGAADALTWWDKAGGKVLRGLTRRRLAEASLFLMPVEEDDDDCRRCGDVDEDDRLWRKG